MSGEGVLRRRFDMSTTGSTISTDQLQCVVKDVGHVKHFPDSHLVGPVESFRHQLQL